MYKAKGMVHEADMDVPYKVVFDFGVITGMWKGVAVSTATYAQSKLQYYHVSAVTKIIFLVMNNNLSS